MSSGYGHATDIAPLFRHSPRIAIVFQAIMKRSQFRTNFGPYSEGS